MPALARWLLVLGIVATLAANVAYGLGHGLMAPLWPRAVGRARRLVRALDDGQPGRPRIADAPGPQDDVPVTDPLGERTAVVFGAELAADRVPSIRAIRAVLHTGQVRAQRLREYLAVAAETHSENLAA